MDTKTQKTKMKNLLRCFAMDDWGPREQRFVVRALILCALIYMAMAVLAVRSIPAQEKPIPQKTDAATIAAAKVGDVLVRKDNREVKKTTEKALSAKIFATPQWDDTGKPLVARDALTGKIESKGVYVNYIPDSATGKLTVTREIGNASVKEFWTVPTTDTKTLSWTVETNATSVKFDGNGLIFIDSQGTPIFNTPAPVAWDSDKKTVTISVRYENATLYYDIIGDKYRYPLTVDPSVVCVDTDALSGFFDVGTSTTYTTARNNPPSPGAYETGIQVGQQIAGSDFALRRSLIRFVTSSIPAAMVIDSAKVRLVLQTDNSVTDFDIRICDTTDSLATGYFNVTMLDEFKGWAASGAYTPTYISDTVINTAGKSVGDTLTFSFNATGLARISLTGTTQLFLLSAKDISGTVNTTNESVVIEDDSPYMQIWYSTPSSGFTRTVPYNKEPNYLWKSGTNVPIWKPGS